MYYSVNKQANVDSYLNNRIDVERDNYSFPQTFFFLFFFIQEFLIVNQEYYIMKKICIC